MSQRAYSSKQHPKHSISKKTASLTASQECRAAYFRPTINEQNDGYTCTFKNLAIKHFKGTCHLPVKQDNTFCSAEQQVIDTNSHNLLNNPEKRSKFNQNCSKRITDLYSEKVECSYCKTSQSPGSVRPMPLQQTKMETPAM